MTPGTREREYLQQPMAPKAKRPKQRHLPEASVKFASIRERRVETQAVLKKIRAELKQEPLRALC